MVRICVKILLVVAIVTLALKGTSSQRGTQDRRSDDYGTTDQSDGDFLGGEWNDQTSDLGDNSYHDDGGKRNSRRNRWVAGHSNCTCGRELSSLKRDLREEVIKTTWPSR